MALRRWLVGRRRRFSASRRTKGIPQSDSHEKLGTCFLSSTTESSRHRHLEMFVRSSLSKRLLVSLSRLCMCMCVIQLYIYIVYMISIYICISLFSICIYFVMYMHMPMYVSMWRRHETSRGPPVWTQFANATVKAQAAHSGACLCNMPPSRVAEADVGSEESRLKPNPRRLFASPLSCHAATGRRGTV